MADPKEVAKLKEAALKKMRDIAVMELDAKNEVDKAEAEADRAKSELENASDADPRPHNLQEYIDYEYWADGEYQRLHHAYEAVRIEYGRTYMQAQQTGLTSDQIHAVAQAARAASTNTDIIVRDIFRKSLVGQSPIYTKEMVDKAILYCYPNMYTKKSTIKWLGIKIDTNHYHYDYCVKLFELLMKCVRINGFFIKTNEHVLLAKFCSMMYFLSNKRGYKALEY